MYVDRSTNFKILQFNDNVANSNCTVQVTLDLMKEMVSC